MSVVLLGRSSSSTWIVANALQRDIGLDAIIIEAQESRTKIFRRRVSRLGVWCASSQLAFSLYSRVLARTSSQRRDEIVAENQWSVSAPARPAVTTVPSVNSDVTLSLLRKLAPKVIVVNGTRIISRRILDGVDSCFINMHAGITPKYRGVHGAYWALANRDGENAGVTVHLVDPGIDTGGILYQARIFPTTGDNFCTYPYLQLAAGIPLLKLAVRDALEGRLQTITNGLPSRLYYHPTIWAYLKNRIQLRVK
jgi:phosphoribosylglycinamide formyltransferase-1